MTQREDLVCLKTLITKNCSRIQQLENQINEKNFELAELRFFKQKIEGLKVQETKRLWAIDHIKDEIRSTPLTKAGNQALSDISKLTSQIMWDIRKIQ